MATVLMVALDNYILDLLSIASQLWLKMYILLVGIASDRKSKDSHTVSQLELRWVVCKLILLDADGF